MAQSTTDSLLAKKDTIKTKNIPHHLLLGIDFVKATINIFDKNKTKLEAIAETELKNNNWLSLQIGYANAKYNSSILSYANNSYGMTFGISKAFFKKENSTDFDNGFAGINFGTAQTKINEAQYSITDYWGTTTGIVAANHHQTYWLEFCGGLRFEIIKRIIVGWRIQGKVILNPNAFSTSSPIYIANYGQGDKQTVFNYNVFVTYKLY